MKPFSILLLSLFFCIFISMDAYPQKSARKHAQTNGLNNSGQPHGQWVYYFDRANTIVQSSGKYKNGIPVKKWVLYYPEGGKNVVTRYYRARAREKRYYRNGNIEKKGWSRLILDDPEAIRYYWDGKWRIYDEGGKLQSVVFYREGELERVIRGQGIEIIFNTP